MDNLEKSKRFNKWLLQIRRDFHMYPEIAYKEIRTSNKIARILNDLGLEVKTGIGKTGVMGLLKGRYPGKTIGLRADMDALPITEKNNVDYTSKKKGLMHACGHDAHITIMLGVVKYLVDNGLKNLLKGNVKFIFQPAEEGGAGAKAMIEDGILENPDVDRVIACHMFPGLQIGHVGIFETQSHASADAVRLFIKGKGGHAARPELCDDPIVAASYFVTQIQTIASRNITPSDSIVVTIGKFVGGTAYNIIPDSVELLGTVRALDEKVRLKAKHRLIEITKGLKKSFNLKECILDYQDGYPVCINDKKVSLFMKNIASQVIGKDYVHILKPGMGGEDFAYYALQKPSSIIMLGSANKKKGINSALHSSTFDIDEGVLKIGVDIFSRAVIEYLR